MKINRRDKIGKVQGNCIYILFDKKIVLYVGSTTQLSNRLSQHSSKWWWQFVTDVDYVPIKADENMLQREMFIIQQLKPIFNVVHGVADHSAVIEQYRQRVLGGCKEIDLTQSFHTEVTYIRESQPHVTPITTANAEPTVIYTPVASVRATVKPKTTYRPVASMRGKVDPYRYAVSKIDTDNGAIFSNIGLSYIKKGSAKPYVVQVIYYNQYGDRCRAPSKSFDCFFKAIKWRNYQVENYKTVLPSSEPMRNMSQDN